MFIFMVKNILYYFFNITEKEKILKSFTTIIEKRGWEGEFESERVRERMLSERDREKAKYSVCGMKGK